MANKVTIFEFEIFIVLSIYCVSVLSLHIESTDSMMYFIAVARLCLISPHGQAAFLLIDWLWTWYTCSTHNEFGVHTATELTFYGFQLRIFWDTIFSGPGTQGLGDPGPRNPGTWGPGDPGTQIGMHCACTYGSLEPWWPRPTHVPYVGLCL